MLLHSWFPLVWYATWQCSEKVDFWPIGRVRDMGVCRQNSCYHVAAFMISFSSWFHLIGYATWPCSEKAEFWPIDPVRGEFMCVCGGDLRTKHLLPCCCISWFHLIWNATWPCSEKVEFGPIVPSLGFWGRGYAGKIFSTMLLYSWFSLIWYITWPCSEKVDLWPSDSNPQGRGWGSWVGVCGQNICYHAAAFSDSL